MAVRTPSPDGLTVSPDAAGDANNPAASPQELAVHRFWGRWSAAGSLPNAAANAAAAPAYDQMRPGDVAFVEGVGQLALLNDRGTSGGADAVWDLLSLSETLQDAYDASGAGQPKIEVTAADGPVSIRDAAVSIGDVFVLEDNAGTDFFAVAEATLNFGLTTQRLFEGTNTIAGYGGVEFYPDAFTRTTLAANNAAFVWSSTLTSSVPGGGGIGNENAPNFCTWNGEVILTEQGNLFNTQSLFNQATTVTCDGANSGPIYTMINQPTFRTSAAGGARTGSQQNAVRSQVRVGPNLGGTFTLLSHEPYFATMILDATGGAAAVTTCNYFAPKAPSLIGGATVGTLNCIDLPAIPAAGITTLRGINSAMSAGTFIDHTGTAPSNFAGEVFINNGVALNLGTAAGSRVQLLRSGAGLMQMVGIGGATNEGLTWDFQGAANTVGVTSTTGAGLRLNLQRLSIGTAATGSGSWFVNVNPGAQAPGAASDFAVVLYTATTVNPTGAITNLATQIINAASIGGTAPTNAANLIVQTSVGAGTNRYGALITSNPSGGTLNYALRVTGSSGVRIDGIFEHTGGTFGALGAAPAAQTAAYTVTNPVTDRAYDTTTVTLQNLAEVVGTIIADLQTFGFFG